MKAGKKLTAHAGESFRVKKFSGVVDGRNVELAAPPGRHMVMLLLGVSDPGVSFSEEDMIRAMGWIPGPALQVELDREKSKCQ